MSDELIPLTIQKLLLEPQAAVPIERAQTGLSQAIIWKCKTPSDFACLRAWPSNHPGFSRLEEIHLAIRDLTEHGIKFTPRVYCNNHGESFTFDGNRFWELTSWLPGQADYLKRPSIAKLLSAAQALAAIHDVWARSAQRVPSPTVEDRLARLSSWLRESDRAEIRRRDSDQSTLDKILAHDTWHAMRQLGPGLLQRLSVLQEEPTSVHTVLRDIWSDHVLYCGESVSGIIDFGALRIDEPTTDLVRLFSSLEPLDAEKRELAIATYESARKIPFRVDRERFGILDQAATLLSAAQWMQWLVIDPREFNTPRPQLVERWQRFLARLDSQF